MTFEEYQEAARRTQNKALNLYKTRLHCLFGLAAEAGEIFDLYQKQLQGHTFEEGQLKMEIGDVLWMISELCDCYGWTLTEVAEANLAKLRVRYPHAFSPAQSIHRIEYRQRVKKLPGIKALHYAQGEGHK